ncbi:MAG: hypothetical protein J6Y78_11040 [Paludibacteraceae bacterium]|nr:hypothetical protein [Paludibacteraceae bacterium]
MPSLNGALEELGELMAQNLTTKGVTASPNDGLTSLVNKVLNITSGSGGGNCYNVKFTENSDDESSGNVAILEVFARYQYQPLTNTSLTVTGSDNSTYTATTNSDGLATFTVNVGADTTYTCTYQGSTDTFSVEYSQYLFFDACTSSAKLSKYGSPVPIYNATLSGTSVMEYDSTENAYVLYGSSSSDYVIFPISKLDGKSNFTFSCELKVNNSTSYPYVGLGVMPNESQLSSTYTEQAYIYRYNASQVYAYAQRRRRTTSTSLSTGRITHTPTNWLKLKIVFNSTTGFTVTWEELDGTVLKTYTGTVTASISDRHYGIYMRGYNSSYKGWIRNIKAEAN